MGMDKWSENLKKTEELSEFRDGWMDGRKFRKEALRNLCMLSYLRVMTQLNFSLSKNISLIRLQFLRPVLLKAFL